MQLYKHIEDFPQGQHKPLVVAVGFFDGLHLGHQRILKTVIESAGKLGALSAVFTFQNHPQTVLRPDLPAPLSLTADDQKLALFEKAGLDLCFYIPFTEAFAQTEAEDFLKETLLKRLQAKKICLGYNAHFGRGRKGNPERMRQLTAAFGFEFEEIPAVEMDGEPVSSSRIRKLVQEGNMISAARCLGRPFSVLGKVVKGDGRGEKIGFPTANIETGLGLLPPEGVYASSVCVDSKMVYEAVSNFGRRPTFQGKEVLPVLEAHLLDYMGNLYDKKLEVFFYKQLRKEMAFRGIPELQLQISKDIQAARNYFLQGAPLPEPGKTALDFRPLKS